MNKNDSIKVYVFPKSAVELKTKNFRVFARNLLRGNRRRNIIFHISFLIPDL